MPDRKRKIIVAVVLMGFSGLVAQIVLLREMMIVFHGNELSIGVILANWLLLESAGAYFLGRRISRTERTLQYFILVKVLFSFFFLSAVYAVRVFKEFLVLVPGEGLGIMPMFFVSFIILLPVSILHGALFTSGCKLYFLCASPETPPDEREKLGVFSIAGVYIYETIGTIAGGLVLTFVLIPLLHSVNTALALALLNLVVCALLLPPFGKMRASAGTRAAGVFLSALLLITAYLLLGSGGDRIHRSSIERQWKNHKLVHYQNSHYGNIVVVEREQEYTFFSDGVPVLTAPNPDIVFVEEFVHLPLLLHPNPRDILVIGGGAGGVINEILKHEVRRVDYAEIDPLMPAVIKEFPTALTTGELSDPRVTIEFHDGRFYLKRTPYQYDVILSGFTDPSTLQANRFFTREFFLTAENRLTKEGILVFGLPGSLTYLSPELAVLNAMALKTIESVFPYVRVIPGDGLNLYLASRSRKVTEEGHAEMIERITARELDLDLITPAHLEYRLHQRWLEWFMAGIDVDSARINLDFKPLGVFYSLVYWNERFSPAFNRFFKKSERINLHSAAAVYLIFFSMLFLFIAFRSRTPVKPALTVCIVSTGFAGMIFDLILIFAFQVLYGYVFYWLGMLVAAFMAGVMAGGLWMTAYLKRIKAAAVPVIIKLELGLIALAMMLPFVFMKAGPLLVYPWFDYSLKIVFLILSFLSGGLVGGAFPLANREYLKTSPDLSDTAGWLYSADLWGGWIGGILGGVVLLPVLGLMETSLVIVMIKISSIALLVFGAARTSMLTPGPDPGKNGKASFFS